MSPSAVFRATIDATTNVTLAQETTSVHVRSHFESLIAVESVTW